MLRLLSGLRPARSTEVTEKSMSTSNMAVRVEKRDRGYDQYGPTPHTLALLRTSCNLLSKTMSTAYSTTIWPQHHMYVDLWEGSKKPMPTYYDLRWQRMYTYYSYAEKKDRRRDVKRRGIVKMIIALMSHRLQKPMGLPTICSSKYYEKCGSMNVRMTMDHHLWPSPWDGLTDGQEMSTE